MHDKEIYTGRLNLGSRTLFLDVKQTWDGRHYIKIASSDKVANGYVHNRIVIHSRDVEMFKQELDRVIFELKKAIKNKPKANPTSR